MQYLEEPEQGGDITKDFTFGQVQSRHKNPRPEVHWVKSTISYCIGVTLSK